MDASNPLPDKLAALAAEICDLWQDHLATLANDPKAKAELVKLLEPQRQFAMQHMQQMMPVGLTPEAGFTTPFTTSFADWFNIRQHASHAGSSNIKQDGNPRAAENPRQDKPDTDGAAATSPASDDGALRMAQLAHRLATVEKRLSQLENKPGRTSPSGRKRGSHETA